ncbi:MAG: 3-isopropylmalate dehydratase large subunit [Chloroflexi bacterium]|nr:3-isopropylmalate dehydratase large subunit [Chloroflexota bacterium]
MGMTMAEKILARKAGLASVRPGQYVTARIDRFMSGDSSTSEMYTAFKEIGISRVWDPARVIAMTDHHSPARDVEAAERDVLKRKFVREFNIAHWYDVGRGGICHQILPENGHALPGMLIAGSDSHTTSYGAFNVAATPISMPESYLVVAKGEAWFRVPETIRFEVSGELSPRVMGKDVILKIAGDYGADFALYKSVEFVGSAVQKMGLSDRWAMACMGVEIGAKFAIFEADQKTFDFLRGRAREPFEPVRSDPDAVFEESYLLDVSSLPPQVACPHDVSNVRPASEVGRIPIDQGFIGSCVGGRLDDLEAAAGILRGKKISPGVRLIVIPASQEVFRDALRAGIVETLVEADAFVAGPTCGPCGSCHLGMLAAGERCIAASSRNFKGRMGSPEAEVYLGSPATVAASALTGYITDPREV